MCEACLTDRITELEEQLAAADTQIARAKADGVRSAKYRLQVNPGEILLVCAESEKISKTTAAALREYYVPFEAEEEESQVMNEWGTEPHTDENFARHVIESDTLDKVLGAREKWVLAKATHTGTEAKRYAAMEEAGSAYYDALSAFWDEVRSVATDAAYEVEG